MIRIVVDGEVLAQPFLDLTGQIETSGSEQGLLSMAFDPDYAENGRFFVGYTGLNSTNVIARFEVSADDPNHSRSRLGARSDLSRRSLPQPQRRPRHVWCPTAISMPDSVMEDPAATRKGTVRTCSVLLGKILRLDVSGDFDSDERAYRIPDDNPFVDQDGAAPEIWAYGFRNPWRFSFDRETGDLYIGDVGQNAREEINFQAADSPGGENYGWNILEGTHASETARTAIPMERCSPVAEYGHDLGMSVTGGYVYRGESAPELVGVYIFADYGSGNVWGAGPRWRRRLATIRTGRVPISPSARSPRMPPASST